MEIYIGAYKELTINNKCQQDNLKHHQFVAGWFGNALKRRMPPGGQLVKELHINMKGPLLVDLITNLCIPFILPLALQTRQFTKRQLRSQEVNAKGVLSKAFMPK